MGFFNGVFVFWFQGGLGKGWGGSWGGPWGGLGEGLLQEPPFEKTIDVGDYMTFRGHTCRLVMDRWKIASLRPRLHCLACHKRWWATALDRVGTCESSLAML